ncbi:hydroxyacylglutathione hydrolase [Cellvibrio sp. PSBB023]|uniref:hydroxyacylglutathione hydrolase n=1 Tax=Cellvibrio sp. PSBB023 TaxID=1945512 RepID=UPI001AEFCF24|nr:hydroxyacylglutathione hydrolase [Cellvibrio sp. PSBB023]
MTSITPIPALDSNYFWVIRPDINMPEVYLVDPGDAAPLITYLRQHQLVPVAILVTHRHRDHIGGIDELLRHWSIPVYGPESPAIPQITHKLKGGDKLFFAKMPLDVIAVPGHTTEHIAYYMPAREDVNEPALFCGDALFAAGCGRMFDGPADVMWASLCTLAALPNATRIYCAHEYTLANLRFACAVEPDNLDIKQRHDQVSALRATNSITLPSSIALEKRTNPFLRCQEAGVKRFIEQQNGHHIESAAEVFALLRKAKDNW